MRERQLKAKLNMDSDQRRTAALARKRRTRRTLLGRSAVIAAAPRQRGLLPKQHRLVIVQRRARGQRHACAVLQEEVHAAVQVPAKRLERVLSGLRVCAGDRRERGDRLIVLGVRALHGWQDSAQVGRFQCCCGLDAFVPCAS